MLKVDRKAIIRHKVLAEGRPIREVARELGHSRNTIRKYRDEVPVATPRRIARRRPVRDLVGPRIDELLDEWAGRTSRKQRITGSRIHAELQKEGFEVGVTTVRAYLRDKRLEAAETFIPLQHRRGDAQIDFFEVVVVVRGKRLVGHMFQMSLPWSDRDFARVYEREDLPSFLDGHDRALRHFGRAPRRAIYDNLKLAVDRVDGADRRLNRHFQRMVAHFAFEPDFARLGEGHDKGGIEVRGKRTRLNELVPIPEGDSLEEINETLLTQLDSRAEKKRDIEGRTVMERFRLEFAEMVSLPVIAFDPRLPAHVKVGHQSTVRLGGATYSLPSHWHRRDTLAWVGATDIRFECRGETHVADRQCRGAKHIEYLHYLPQLARRPHAVRQVAPELMVELGGPWPRLWEVLLAVFEPLPAARVMANLLEALRHDRPELEAAITGLLETSSALPPRPATPEHPVVVPDALKSLVVHGADARAYDVLLQGAIR